MQRTPTSGQSLHSSQPNLCTDKDEACGIRNINIKKRKNTADHESIIDLKESLLQSFKEMFNAEVAEMKKQNDKILESNAEIMKLLQENTKNYTILNEKVNVLESELATTVKRLNDLDLQVHELQKQQNKSMLEIRNVPRNNKENLQEIVTKLYETLSLKSDLPNDSEIFRRGNNEKASIIIKFKSMKEKDYLTNAIKKFYKDKGNKLNSKHLGVQGNQVNVYISEPLTYITKGLLESARDLIKKGIYKYCWTSRGNVLIRKDNGTPAIVIRSLGQIKDLTHA